MVKRREEREDKKMTGLYSNILHWPLQRKKRDGLILFHCSAFLCRGDLENCRVPLENFYLRH